VSKLLKACLQRTQTLQFKVQHANYTRLPSHPLPTDNKQLPCGHQRREALVPGASSRRRRLSMSKGACLSVSVCLSVCSGAHSSLGAERTMRTRAARLSIHGLCSVRLWDVSYTGTVLWWVETIRTDGCGPPGGANVSK